MGFSVTTPVGAAMIGHRSVAGRVWGVGTFQPQSFVIMNGTQNASPTLLAVANEELAMSLAQKAGVRVGVIGPPATVAASPQGGVGGHGATVYHRDFFGSPS